MNLPNEIRIVIADDHPIVRSGLRTVIESHAALRVIAEADDGAAALAAIAQTQPDIAILDVNMPGLSGFDLARQLQTHKLSVAVIFLTIHSDAVMFNEALDLGARGYVLKESAVTDIVNSIHAVAAGELFISAALTEQLQQRQANATATPKTGLPTLTATERRILRLIAANKESKDIAAELSISHRTVENHRANICRKLGLSGHNALLHFALHHKLDLLY
ncbi:MAG: response regulator transcription factor [Acidobacteria bacterium]|nr:response regulator transcription factor [Acidobacteriota bacterium]